jgi:hypothetical protein
VATGRYQFIPQTIQVILSRLVGDKREPWGTMPSDLVDVASRALRELMATANQDLQVDAKGRPTTSAGEAFLQAWQDTLFAWGDAVWPRHPDLDSVAASYKAASDAMLTLSDAPFDVCRAAGCLVGKGEEAAATQIRQEIHRLLGEIPARRYASEEERRVMRDAILIAAGRRNWRFSVLGAAANPIRQHHLKDAEILLKASR